MRIVFAVLLLCIAFAASYPSHQDADDEVANSELELELRSILDQLTEEREIESSDEDDDEENAVFSKRQGGHNVVDKQSKCEIQCIHSERHPSRGKGKSVKDAAKVCKNRCNLPGKKTPGPRSKPKPVRPIKTRAFIDEDDDSVGSEDQDVKRREFYDYLMEQIQRNADE
ncbi:unnamed protein product [Adineta ricciae]|uniref:Uncharacterized protein n=1 Tax=Adineta ricciae TaxID=249248 RepID=A0A815N6Y9_ADIRI|nr:unnamed protein product [Adineta ricciae]CAF1430879.1 unnamed protein product [Adineta ricciae]